MGQKRILFILAISIISGGCSQTVTLSNEAGTNTFVYDCNDIRNQMETGEDIKILGEIVREVGSELREKDRRVTLSALSSASRERDFRTVERIIVEYKCESMER